LLRQVLRSVSLIALVATAGCTAIGDMSDRIVGNSYQRSSQNSPSAQTALAIPPDVNARPDLPPPTVAQAQPAPMPMPVSRPASQQMAANQMPMQTAPVAAPAMQNAALPRGAAGLQAGNSDNYQIGPGDQLDIFVWRSPELSTRVPVRPDGKISIPLVEDAVAVGKTPSVLARELEEKLKAYVKEPIVTVIVSNFVGPFSQQVRVIGEASQPRAIPYRTNMSILDVMIEVGGLTRFAAGDRAIIMRNENGQQQTIKVHLDSLVKDGDVAENMQMRPGDILIIPQRYF